MRILSYVFHMMFNPLTLPLSQRQSAQNRPIANHARRVRLVLLALGSPLLAQDASTTQPLGRAAYVALFRVEQEPTYASFPGLVFGMPREPHGGQRLRILYEAAIAPPFFLFAGERPWLVAITPKILVRQYAGGSYPVPPPSYMPRVTAYYWGWPFTVRTHVDSAVYAFLRLGHHSNGQEGPFFDSTATTPSGSLVPNYRDGDFFTSYLELGLMQRAFRYGPLVGAQQLSVEWHPEGWMAKAMRPTYGRYRAHIDSRFQLPSRRLGPVDGAVVSLGYIGGSLAPERRAFRHRPTVSVTFYSDVADIGEFHPFVTYYTGQDYYNIRYDRNLSTVRIGVMSGVAKLTASP